MKLVLESFKGEKDGPTNSRPAHHISTQQGSFRWGGEIFANYHLVTICFLERLHLAWKTPQMQGCLRLENFRYFWPFPLLVGFERVPIKTQGWQMVLYLPNWIILIAWGVLSNHTFNVSVFPGYSRDAGLLLEFFRFWHIFELWTVAKGRRPAWGIAPRPPL